MKTNKEVDDFLKIKESKEYIRDLFRGKIEIPDNILKTSFDKTKQIIDKYMPDAVNSKWCNCENKVNDKKSICPLHDLEQ